MFAQKISVLTIAFMMTVSMAYTASAAVSPADDQSVNAACAADAATSGCSGQQASHGLVKCMQTYRKANSSFAFSTGCKAAMIKRDADRKASK